MAAEYTEVEADPDDAEGKVLDTLANGMPYVFVVATSLEPLNLRVASGYDLDVIRALIEQTVKALPGKQRVKITDELVDDLADVAFAGGFETRRALVRAALEALGFEVTE